MKTKKNKKSDDRIFIDPYHQTQENDHEALMDLAKRMEQQKPAA